MFLIATLSTTDISKIGAGSIPDLRCKKPSYRPKPLRRSTKQNVN